VKVADSTLLSIWMLVVMEKAWCRMMMIFQWLNKY